MCPPYRRVTHAHQGGGTRAAAGPGGRVAGKHPIPGLLALQRAAGNRAVVQRMLRKKSGNTKKPSSFIAVRNDPAIKSAREAVVALIKAIDRSLTVNIDYTDAKDLVEQATTMLGTPTAKLVELASDATLTLFEAYWTQESIDYSAVENEIAKRRKAAEKASFTLDTSIRPPTLPPNYPKVTSAKLKPASRTGREEGAFHRVTTTMNELAGATTSNVNQELAKIEKKRGNLFPVGEDQEVFMQVCPGCGRSMDVNLFEVDHQDAFSHIRDQLWKLADDMTQDPDLADGIEDDLGTKFDLYFAASISRRGKKKTTTLEPTKYAMSVFSNDLENLLRLCRLCNGATGKSDTDVLEWYMNNSLLGPEFIQHYVDDQSSQQVPMRAKGDKGWGHAAREWFAQRHWPVLKKIRPIANFQEVVHKSLMAETDVKLKAAYARRASEQGRLTARGEQIERQNDISIGMTEVLTEGHIRTDQPMIGKKSPEADVKQFRTFRDEQVQARIKKRATETPEYKIGLSDGYGGKPEDLKAYADMETQRYREGRKAGKAVAAAERERGYADGVTGTRTLNSGQSAYYDEGFGLGDTRCADVVEAGRRHGTKNADLSSGVALDELGAAFLMQAYMNAYNDGRRTQKI